jgi:hypothetical protein
VILLGLAGVARADEASVRDISVTLAAAISPDPDDSIAQVAPDTKAPTTTPGPTTSPKSSVKPKTTPPKPPARRPTEDLSRPAEEPLRPAGEQPSPNLLASMYGGNAPPAERLAGTPNMFGDFFNNMGGCVMGVFSHPPAATESFCADLPLAAASRRVKIAEDNNALPQDRVFFLYNHFENALQMQSTLPEPFQRSFCVDRYTMGVEKTLNCCWSVELLMPLAGQTEVSTTDFGISGGCTGNLAVIIKRLLYESDTTAVAVGLGIDAPTGSNVQGYASVVDTGYTSKFNYFTMHNDAVHLLPYMGFLRKPNCRFFYQGFAQLDIGANGNRIDYQSIYYTNYLGRHTSELIDSGQLGVLNEQNLLYLDLSGGYWLYRNPCACGLTGLAAMLELHYTTTLQDTDVVQRSAFPTAFQLTFENCYNRVDVVNLTVGLHSEFANHTLCRVGAVFPLQSGDNRSFDSEVQVQIERRF